MPKQRYSDEPCTTIKLFGNNLFLLSKLIANIKAPYTVFSQSRSLVNPETQQYYCFLNVKNEDSAAQLQEVSAYPQEA